MNRLFALAVGDITQCATIDEAVEINCRERIPHLKHGSKQEEKFVRIMDSYKRLEHLHVHDMRDSAASAMINAGIDATRSVPYLNL